MNSFERKNLTLKNFTVHSQQFCGLCMSYSSKPSAVHGPDASSCAGGFATRCADCKQRLTPRLLIF